MAAPWVAALAVALVVAAVFAPAADLGFVNWDDDVYIYKNAELAPVSPAYIAQAFTVVSASNYHPLTMISYSMDRALWGEGPRGYHITNIALHALNTAIVLLLVWWMAGIASPSIAPGARLIVAIAAALIFGAHPLRVESVAWVSERKDMLYAMFYLASIAAYVQFSEGGGVRYFALSIAAFALSLLSKPMAVSLPLVLLLIDYYPYGRGAGVRPIYIITKLPYFALAAASAVLTIMLQERATSSVQQIYAHERALNALKAVALYMRNFIWPAELAPLYPLRVPVRFSAWEYAFAALAIVITIYCVMRWRARGNPRLVPAMWAWFMVSILPVIGIVQVGQQYAADRYTYLPMLGPAIIVAAGIGWAISRTSRTWAVAIVMIVTLVMGALAMKTRDQIEIWRSSKSLWSHELRLYPYQQLAFYKMGHAHQSEGDLRKAIEYFTLAIQLDPRDSASHLSRGVAYFLVGSYASARVDLDKALALRPGERNAIYYKSMADKALGEAQHGR